MKVSWDDYSQYMEKQNMFQTTNQINSKGWTKGIRHRLEQVPILMNSCSQVKSGH